jgi:hypothetical protein
MPTIIDSLLVRLGFQTDPSGLHGFAKAVDQAKGMALGLGVAISGAAYGIAHMVRSSAERMGDIQDFSERVNMSAREVAALGKVAAEHDSSMEAMQSTISSLNAVVGQAASGFPRAQMMLRRFGLTAKNAATGDVKTFNEIMADVIEKMQAAGTGKRLAMANALGIDPKLIPMLTEGVKNFEQLRDNALNANPFAAKDYKLAEMTDKLFLKAEASTKRLKDRLAVGLMPTVNDLLKKFMAWTADEKNIRKIQDAVNGVVKVVQLLVDNWKGIAAVLGVIYAHKYGAMFMGWGQQLASVSKHLTTGAGAAEMLKGGFKGIAGILTGGLLAALGLVIEDLWVFYEGGTSVTGWLLERFPYAVEVAIAAIGALGAALLAISTGSGAIGLTILGITGLVVVAKELRDSWDPIAEWWDDLWDGMGNAVAKTWNSIPGPLRGALQLATGGGFDTSEMDIDVNRKFRNSTVNLGQATANWKPWIAEDPSGQPSWLTPRGSATIAHASTDNSMHIGEVHVHEAANGKETWNRIQQAAREQTRNGQSGVR